jgi:hypothetical protein
MLGSAPQRIVRPFSARRHVNRRIFRFSILIGAVATCLTVFLCVAAVYPSVQSSREVNQRTLAAINCTESGCDTSAVTTDWQISDADYVIDKQTGYVMNVPGSTSGNPARFTPLDYSDTAFIKRFRQPSTYSAPNGEVWRLYSREVNADGKNFEALVGYAEIAPWKMIDSPQSMIGEVDNKLKREVDRIAANLQTKKVDLHGVRTDGFEVVDAKTEKVLDWGPWLPIFLPKYVTLPAPGCRPYVYDGELYLVQTDTKGRLLAISLVSVGGLWWLAILAGFAFLSTSAIARLLSRRFLRGYFAMRGLRLPTLAEALQNGEDQKTEFKRGISSNYAGVSKSEDELVESVAAFANTNDGMILIGVDDSGHLKGLDVDSKQKDRLLQKIYQLVRNRIKPMPPIQVTFEELRGLVVAKITVARGDAPAYMMDGTIYIRSGSSDVQAQPEDLKSLVMEYAA